MRQILLAIMTPSVPLAQAACTDYALAVDVNDLTGTASYSGAAVGAHHKTG